jgi:phosphoserine phosphatase RsbU/P
VRIDSPALLVVDDNDDNRYTLTRRLTREGYTNLTTATNGREALDLLQSKPFDLILLDIMMPDMNGYEVLERMKTGTELRNIPVIMISALSEIDSVIRCIELGAEDYLPKPFDPVLLHARVGASLEKKRLRDEVRASLVRLERELEAARQLQASMLPSTFPVWSPDLPLDVHALMDPAREVGGDLYDFFPVSDDIYCFLVGDVSDKGASAAMFMARTRSLVRMAVELSRRFGQTVAEPAVLAEVVNWELCQNNRDCMFVTIFLGFLDMTSGVLTYVNAGHPGPYILRTAGMIEHVAEGSNLPIAVRASASYQDQTITLRCKDVIFVFTDGVTEAINASNEFYGKDRLEADLRDVMKLAPREIVHAIKHQVDVFTGEGLKADDMAILTLRWDGAADAAEWSDGARAVLGQPI